MCALPTVEVVIVQDDRHGIFRVYVYASLKQAQQEIPHWIRKEYQACYGGTELGKWHDDRRYAFGGATVTIEQKHIYPEKK